MEQHEQQREAIVEENGSVKKTMKLTAIGVLVTALVGFLIAIGSSGLKSMAQEAAKEAVTDTIKQNAVSIADLKKEVNDNIQTDVKEHSDFKNTVDLIKQELQTIKAQNAELKSELSQQRRELEELKRLLLEFFRNQ